MLSAYFWRSRISIFLVLLLSAFSAACEGKDEQRPSASARDAGDDIGADSVGEDIGADSVGEDIGADSVGEDIGEDAADAERSGDIDVGEEGSLEVRIVSGPEGLVSESQFPLLIEFELVHPNSSAWLECRVYEEYSSTGQAWFSCESPMSLTLDTLPFGQYIFSVRAQDNEGNISTNPSQISWAFLPPPPETTLDFGPDSVTTNRRAQFYYSANHADSFECNLDETGWQSCSSNGIEYTDLELGEHLFEVRATFMTVVDPSPASYTWTVEEL